MLPMLIERLGSTAVQGAAASLTQLNQIGESFEAMLYGSSGADASAATSADDGISLDKLAARIAELGESLRTQLGERLAAAGVSLDGPIELERNAVGQWLLADPDGADRVAVEQALAELPPDFLSKLTEYRRAVAVQAELRGGSVGGGMSDLIDERDAVRVSVSADDLSVS